MGTRGESIPAMEESLFVMIEAKAKTEKTKQGQEENQKGLQEGNSLIRQDMPFYFRESRQYVWIRECLVATHAHYVRLIWTVKITDFIKDSKILT